MTFPVITIRGGILSFKSSQEDLGKCTTTAFKNGWFRGLTILDSEGFEYTVMDAKNPRNTGKKLYSGLLAPKVIEVEVQVSSPRQLTVAEMRESIRGAIRCGSEFWPHDRDMVAVLGEVDRADSIRRLWEVITSVVTA